MNGIFISYRREDSAFVSGLIHERLAQHFGSDTIFTDIDSIPLGVNFKKHVDEQVGKCDVFLAVIGEKWLSTTDDGDRPRIRQPGDFVRLEIESALKREIPVIPLLVGNVVMPAADELPESLRELVVRNGTPIRPKPTFDSDIERLIRGIEKHLGTQAKAEQAAAINAVEHVERNTQEEATRQAEQKARRKSEEEQKRRQRAEVEARRKAELESKQRKEERQRQEAEAERQSAKVQRQKPPGTKRDMESPEALGNRKGVPEHAKPPRVAKRTPPQSRATRTPPSERTPRRTLLTISASLAVVVLSVGVFWGIYDTGTGTNQVANSTEVNIQQLLADAERHYQAGRLDSPKGENALERYRVVLDLDPDNQVAQAGLDRVVTRFIALADGALAEQKLDQAESFLAKAKRIAPANAEVVGVRTQLEKVRAATQERKKVELLLATAERDLQQGRLDSPKGNNAVEGYRAVLALDSDNQSAQAGLDRVLSRYLAHADGAVDEQELDKAEEYLAKAEGIEPTNAGVLNIRARIEKARATTQEGEKIRLLLANAENDLQQDRLTSPKGNNAAERYRAVLDLDAGNQAARTGLGRVVSRYIALANGAMAGDKFGKANGYLAKADEISPANAEVAGARSRLAKAQAKALERRKIVRLLANAERHYQAGRLDSPKGNNAVEAYAFVFILDPDNPSARAGLGRVVKRYVDLGVQSLADQKPDRVAEYLAKAERFEPDNPAVVDLRKQLDKALKTPSQLAFAVFPFQSLAICHYSVREEVTNAADSIIRKLPRAKLEYSFYGEGADPKVIPGMHELWSENAARRKPELDIVRKAGRKLGVNGVLMAWYKCSRSQYVSEDNYEVEVYLIDVYRDQVFHAKENFLDADRAVSRVFDHFFAAYSIGSG